MHLFRFTSSEFKERPIEICFLPNSAVLCSQKPLFAGLMESISGVHSEAEVNRLGLKPLNLTNAATARQEQKSLSRTRHGNDVRPDMCLRSGPDDSAFSSGNGKWILISSHRSLPKVRIRLTTAITGNINLMTLKNCRLDCPCLATLVVQNRLRRIFRPRSCIIRLI